MEYCQYIYTIFYIFNIYICIYIDNIPYQMQNKNQKHMCVYLVKLYRCPCETGVLAEAEAAQGPWVICPGSAFSIHSQARNSTNEGDS